MPRPILKCQQDSDQSPTSTPLPFASCSTATVLLSPHVHFPPTPRMAEIHITHSSTSYDRAPIEVSQNSCELPERGGRVYPLSPEAQMGAIGSYFHPRAYNACESEPMDIPAPPFSPPPLVPDISSSSDSDDADGLAMTPPGPSAIPPISIHFAVPSSHPPLPHTHSQEEIANALSFLPHAHPLFNTREREKEKGRGRPRLARSGSRRDVKSLSAHCTFAEPTLDGCLGGF